MLVSELEKNAEMTTSTRNTISSVRKGISLTASEPQRGMGQLGGPLSIGEGTARAYVVLINGAG